MHFNYFDYAQYKFSQCKQKGFAPILILVGMLVIIGIAGGAYYFSKSSNIIHVNTVITLTPTSTPMPYSLNKDSLIGIWQDDFMLAAGWGNRYQFYPSGKFAHIASQRDCTKINLGEVGTWELNGTQLLLTAKKRVVLIESTLVDSMGSCKTPKMTQGGTKEVQIISDSPIVKMELKVRPPKADEPSYYPALLFENTAYWRFNNDLKNEPPFKDLGLSGCGPDQDPCF